MSTTSLSIFKRELGMSPIEFVISEKYDVQKITKKPPSIQINEVCYLSGFDDSNYFIRLFKKHEGITQNNTSYCT
jgi:YesN/AraC family two-component response regulator